ncbi:hypothetical protein HPP92_006443 [Vanilla planifolia]|uniref:Uncharacterized protein n=1 Tax=Vanilla planifolia TaxID=51239 RepID=A0A835VAA4_VANPL|nr:hypothetical protein HPP92_006443 [Vanilla planifolia]
MAGRQRQQNIIATNDVGRRQRRPPPGHRISPRRSFGPPGRSHARRLRRVHLSASQASDIIAWQLPDLRPFSRFGQGDGAVKAVVAYGNRVFTAHQDRRIRVWKVSRRAENAFRPVATLPTARDCLVRLERSSFVETRRNHRRSDRARRHHLFVSPSPAALIFLRLVDKTSRGGPPDLVPGINQSSRRRHQRHRRPQRAALLRLCRRQDSALGKGEDLSFPKGDVGEQKRRFLEHGGRLRGWKAGLRWRPDGCVMGWEGQGLRLVCHVVAHTMPVLCLCSTAAFVCSGSADMSIGLWKREGEGKLQRIGTIRGHEGPVKCLQASWNYVGEGFMLYSGGLDKSLRVCGC